MAKNDFVPERTEFFGEYVRDLGRAQRSIKSALPNLTREQCNATIQAAREELARVDTMLAKLTSGDAPVGEPEKLPLLMGGEGGVAA